MEILQVVLKYIAYFVLGSVVLYVVLFMGLISIPYINEGKNALKTFITDDYIIAAEDVEVIEISNDEKPLPYEYKSGTGDLDAAKGMVLEPDGVISDRMRVFDGDPGMNVDVLMSAKESNSIVFKNNTVYQFKNNQLGEMIGEFSNPALAFVRHVMPINEKLAFVNGDRIDAQYADPYLWQVDLKSLDKTLLTEKPYYSFKRPPKVFLPEDFDGVVAVYYEGELHFGISAGGDNSRPEYSVVRIFNDDYPEGRDIARFSFCAATIVNVDFKEGSIIVTGDPGRPGGEAKNRKPARVWKININKNEKLHA